MPQIQQITADLISVNQCNQRHRCWRGFVIRAWCKFINGTQMTQIQQITADLISVDQCNQRPAAGAVL